MTYSPSAEHMERYGRLLVDYALGGGAGIRPGDVVNVVGHDSAKPLYAEVCRAVWRSGGHVLGQYLPDDDAVAKLGRDFHELASDGQLDFFSEPFWRGVSEQSDHLVYIHSEADPHALDGVDPDRIMRAQEAMRPLASWMEAKETAGRFSWTIGQYPTAANAQEAQMSLQEYWEQIVLACYLDDEDPIARWREINRQIEDTAAALTALPIERLHVEGEDADLWITLGERRKWIGGGGRNIPSYEVYTSPDWRGTEGWIRFSEPLYIHGTLIRGVELEFREGIVVRADAQENVELLRSMIAADNADRIGEFSLTDGRLSRITRFMASTLYDENVGGPNGNTHLAVGRSYRVTLDGDPGELDDDEWERLGFNESAVHTDIVSRTERTVTAVLRGGEERVIYRGGQFTL